MKKYSIIIGLGVVAVIAAATAYAAYTPTPANLAVCDMNGDGQIDIRDINMVIALRGSTVIPGSLGDANGDGVINAIDARICTGWCNNTGCKTSP